MKIFPKDIQSAVTQEECAKLSSMAKDKIVLELGSQFGRSTIALAATAKIVHSVDWHLGDHYTGAGDSAAVFIANLSRYKMREKVALHVGKFEDVLPVLKEGSFDFCFIDAFHEQKTVERDANAVLPLMKVGGIIAFHDYGLAQFGVTQAVDKLAKLRGSKVERKGSLAIVALYDEDIVGDVL